MCASGVGCVLHRLQGDDRYRLCQSDYAGQRPAGSAAAVVRPHTTASLLSHHHASFQSSSSTDRCKWLHSFSLLFRCRDTAGQERFRSLIPSYIRDATVAVLVYDIGSRQSFASCAHWLTDVHKDRGTDILVLLAGNKSDLAHDGKRAVPAAEGRNWARENGLLWCEVSAKTGEGVKAMMTRLVACLPAESEREERVEGFGSESKGGAGAGSGGTAGTVDVKLTGQPNELTSSGCYC